MAAWQAATSQARGGVAAVAGPQPASASQSRCVAPWSASRRTPPARQDLMREAVARYLAAERRKASRR